MAEGSSLVVDRNGVIREWSAGAALLLGHSAAEAIGRRIDLIVPPEERDAHWAGFNAAMTSGVLHYGPQEPIEAQAVTKSGGRIDVAITLVPRRDDCGRILALDVTIAPV
jgi:PAS domain S-box-containing protein